MKITCEGCNLKNSCKYREKILAIISRERCLDVNDDCTEIIKTTVAIRREMLQGNTPPAVKISGIIFVAPEFIIYL